MAPDSSCDARTRTIDHPKNDDTWDGLYEVSFLRHIDIDTRSFMYASTVVEDRFIVP